jgi:hypothetical protein
VQRGRDGIRQASPNRGGSWQVKVHAGLLCGPGEQDGQLLSASQARLEACVT